MNLPRLRRIASLALAVSLGLVPFVAPRPAAASSHREAPGIAKYPLWDNTDVYAFRDPIVTDQLTILANWIPLEDPSGFPNFFHFDENAWYQIHIDNDGDGIEDITYRFVFTENVRNPNTFLNFTGPVHALDDPNVNVYYTYTVDKIIGPAGNDVAPANVTRVGSGLLEIPNNAGPATFPGGYSQGSGLIAGVYALDGNARAFAGPRSDMFFVDLGWLGDLLNFRANVLPGNHGGGINGVAGFNTHTIGMQIPLAQVTRNGQFPTDAANPNSIIGVWSDTWVPQTRVYQTTGAKPAVSGPYVQVSRLGVPLVNEVVIPYGMKDHFNASSPRDDAQYASFVLDPELPKILKALFNIDSPSAPRNDLVNVVQGFPGLTRRPNEAIADELRINLAIAPTPIAPVDMTNRMGVLGGDNAGFPNGRRPWDDVVDIEIQVLAGVLVPAFNVAPNNQLGDGVDGPEKPFLAAFPYLRSPSSGYTHSHDNPPQVLHPSRAHPAGE
jgi:hypothetical protein